MKFDLYKILGISRDANEDEIKAAYRQGVKAAHPDRGGDREEFDKLNTAKIVLLDPKKRSRYDESGGVDLEPDNEQAMILNIVMEAIDEVLRVIEHKNAHPCQFDLLSDARMALNHKIAVLGQQLPPLKEGAKRIGEVANCIKSKGAKPNRLRSVFEARKMDLERRIAQTKNTIELHNKAYDLLKEHTFDFDRHG